MPVCKNCNGTSEVTLVGDFKIPCKECSSSFEMLEIKSHKEFVETFGELDTQVEKDENNHISKKSIGVGVSRSRVRCPNCTVYLDITSIEETGAGEYRIEAKCSSRWCRAATWADQFKFCSQEEIENKKMIFQVSYCFLYPKGGGTIDFVFENDFYTTVISRDNQTIKVIAENEDAVEMFANRPCSPSYEYDCGYGKKMCLPCRGKRMTEMREKLRQRDGKSLIKEQKTESLIESKDSKRVSYRIDPAPAFSVTTSVTVPCSKCFEHTVFKGNKLGSHIDELLDTAGWVRKPGDGFYCPACR